MQVPPDMSHFVVVQRVDVRGLDHPMLSTTDRPGRTNQVRVNLPAPILRPESFAVGGARSSPPSQSFCVRVISYM